MKIILFLAIFVATTIQISSQGFGQEESAIIDQMNALSASMKRDGSGGKAYAAILSPDYSRWTLGSTLINDRATWLKGINDWFNSGWRIAESENNIIEIKVYGDYAFVRRVATETYAGPNGENQVFQSGVVEIWNKKDKIWLLLQASISPKQIR